MPKEIRAESLSSNRPRVSPYPLRSSRNNKLKGPESPLQSEGVKQWEEIRCPICMEPPHNAVLLNCSSFSKGCRPYMCDTSSRHSNCFKQYRKNNNNRFDSKILSCPLCRGEVYGTMKVTGARRFLNAKPRSCYLDTCSFSGTYAQLKNHVKSEHPDINPTKVDPFKQLDWEHMERETDYADMLSTMEFQFPRRDSEETNSVLQVRTLPPYYPLLEARLTGIRLSVASNSARLARLEYRATVYRGWLQ